MKKLIQIYSDAMPTFEKVSSEHKGVSDPLFMSVPDGYSQTNVRLLIVGQQTHGWQNEKVGVKGLLQTYRNFDLGREYTKSPFWQASHKLSDEINSSGPKRAFLWSNLIKVDQCQDRPIPEIEEAVSALGLLPEEIRLLKPHAVVFFTGPFYDDRLQRTFPNVEFRKVRSDLFQLIHPNLPKKSFRTYHPSYLIRSGKKDVLDEIVNAIIAD